MSDQAQSVQARVADARGKIITFMREICAIPSMESQIGPVGERIQAEMKSLDDVVDAAEWYALFPHWLAAGA